jgi:hypothetical protein
VVLVGVITSNSRVVRFARGVGTFRFDVTQRSVSSRDAAAFRFCVTSENLAGDVPSRDVSARDVQDARRAHVRSVW